MEGKSFKRYFIYLLTKFNVFILLSVQKKSACFVYYFVYPKFFRCSKAQNARKGKHFATKKTKKWGLFSHKGYL